MKIIGVFSGLTRFFAAVLIIPVISTLLFLMFAIPIAFKLFGTYILAGFVIFVIWKLRKQIMKVIPF